MPALKMAMKALDTLTPKDISEIKAMKNPPAPVKLVLTAVCVMKEYASQRDLIVLSMKLEEICQ